MMTERDLWWEARQKTAKKGQPNILQKILVSLRGKPTQTRTQLLIRENPAVVVDLNLYRPGVNVKALIDRGINRFILRMGGPSRWLEGSWAYKEDPTWRPYMDALDAAGVDVHKQVIGYYIHNAAEDWRLQGDLDVHVQLVNEWTSGGYMPAAFCCDHEVAKFWRGNSEITITDFNLVESLAAVTDKVYKKWRKMSSIYSARWFINQFARDRHIQFFDNINRPESQGGVGIQRPAWLAWVPAPKMGETTWESASQFVNAQITPSGQQTSDYLHIGSYTPADLWQCLFTFRTPELKTGVDISISRGSLAEFDAAFGLTATTPPPPTPEPPPNNPPPANTQYVTRDEFLAHSHTYTVVGSTSGPITAAG